MKEPIIDDPHHGRKEHFFVITTVIVAFAVLFGLLYYGVTVSIDPVLTIVVVLLIVAMFIISAFLFDWAFYEKA